MFRFARTLRRSDAPDHPEAQILLDALDRGGRGCVDEARPELLAVSTVVHPLARGGDPFSQRHRRRVPDYGAGGSHRGDGAA